MKSIFCVGVISLLATSAAAQDRNDVDEALPELVNRVQEMVAQTPEFRGIRIHGAAIVDRRAGEGQDIRFRAEGADLDQRARLQEAVTGLMRDDPLWQRWMQANGVEVTYEDAVLDPAMARRVHPSPEEQAHIEALLTAVQDRIETSPQVSGAFVHDAILVRRVDGPGYALQIRGRVAAEEQRGMVSEVFTEVMAADPYWRERRGDVFISLEPVVVAPPSLQWGLRYFTMGINAFWRGDFFTAEQALTRAIAHAPDVVVYRWWKVVTLLALGQDARAEALLVPLLQQNPWGQYDSTIATALERIQGPLRWELQHLEQRVLLDVLP